MRVCEHQPNVMALIKFVLLKYQQTFIGRRAYSEGLPRKFSEGFLKTLSKGLALAEVLFQAFSLGLLRTFSWGLLRTFSWGLLHKFSHSLLRVLFEGLAFGKFLQSVSEKIIYESNMSTLFSFLL